MIATKLFENPENIEGVIKEAFQTVDSQLCEDMAKELETILSPKKYCFPCLNHDSKKDKEVFSKINNSYLESSDWLWLCLNYALYS